jgi:DNA-binding SARP family transcriptional activator
VELRILGPFEVFDDAGREVRVPSGRERALLVVLALRRGEVVSTDTLVDALWGEHPPSTAVKAVHGYVSHLRRLLGPRAGDVLSTRHPGYVLRIETDAVDAARFERTAQEGRRALGDDDPEEALVRLDEALGLWRGPALVDFSFDDFARQDIERLEALRVEAMEDRGDALLRLGRHGELVSELGPLVEAHPLRERLRGQLMLALYRRGRQAEALDVYARGRRLLAGELGLEPGAELQRLERAILAQDPALDDSPAQTRENARGVVSAPGGKRRRGRRLRLLVSALLLALVFAAATLSYILVRSEAPSRVGVAPPALVVVDPATNRIVASIPLGSRPVAVAAGAGAVWVGDEQDGTITEVDGQHLRAVRTIAIGAPVVDLAFGLGGVWAATGASGEVVRVDPLLGAVAERIPLGDPNDPVEPTAAAIGVGDGRVWVGALDGLARVSPSAGRVVETVDLGRSNALQVAVGGGAVWASTNASRATRVDASSGRKTAEFYAGSSVYAVALGAHAL